MWLLSICNNPLEIKPYRLFIIQLAFKTIKRYLIKTIPLTLGYIAVIKRLLQGISNKYNYHKSEKQNMLQALMRPIENFVNRIGSFVYCGFGCTKSKNFDKFMKTCDYLATKLHLGHNSIEEVNHFTFRSSASAVKIEILKEKNINNIIDLRMTTLKKELVENYKQAGINYYHIPLNPLDINLENLKKALFIALMSQEEKVIIHCARGIDRTGLVVGLIRIFQDSWDKSMALDEMVSYGFIPDNFPMMNKAFERLANNLSDEMI